MLADSQGQLRRGITTSQHKEATLNDLRFSNRIAFHFSPEISLLVQISVPRRITMGLVSYHLFGLKKQMDFR